MDGYINSIDLHLHDMCRPRRSSRLAGNEAKNGPMDYGGGGGGGRNVDHDVFYPSTCPDYAEQVGRPYHCCAQLLQFHRLLTSEGTVLIRCNYSHLLFVYWHKQFPVSNYRSITGKLLLPMLASTWTHLCLNIAISSANFTILVSKVGLSPSSHILM